MAALVEAEALVAYLDKVGGSPRAAGLAEEAAETASAFVVAYATRLRPTPDGLNVVGGAPPVVRRVALHLAARIANNPSAIRSVSTGDQQTDLPAVGLLYLESLMLNAYRRRTA